MERNIPQIIIDILESRGIGDKELDEFFSPVPKLAHNPFLLTNMREGVDLLLSAIDSGKKIYIYGDYDVDGITSTALMMKVIGSLTNNVYYYIPSRLDEGYGLHKESIDKIHEEGGELIVTVDCGSVSKLETEYAHSLGIETLVTDHHNVSEVRAEGLIINPRLEGDKYPFKGLAGVGVAYKLALAISKERSIPKEIMSEILELVTLGTIADIMPLLDENRTIVKFGLRFLHLGGRNKGLRRLIDLSGLDYRTLRAGDLSYGIAPKINAAGRLGDATIGVKLLLAETEEDIEKYCNILIDANRERKSLTDKAYETGLELAPEEMKKGDFVVLEINNSHEGVLGIVAGKVRESINRPVIVISKNGDSYKGTGRSIPSVDLFKMLDKYRESFISFGGHSAACGFTISANNIQDLKNKLNADIADLLATDESIFDVDYHYDAMINPDIVDMELAEVIELLEPCGKSNEIPSFMFKSVNIVDWKFLKNEKYAKFNILTDDNKRIECMLFHDADKYYEIAQSNMPVDIIGSIEINRWKDSARLQVIVDWMLQ